MPIRLRLPAAWPFYLLGSLFLLLSLVTIVGERGALHLWRLRGEKTQLDEQNYRLQMENRTLRERVMRIRDDNQYLEKLAREELNLVRPGEVVYRFPKAEPRPRQVNESFESPPSKGQKPPR